MDARKYADSAEQINCTIRATGRINGKLTGKSGIYTEPLLFLGGDGARGLKEPLTVTLTFNTVGSGAAPGKPLKESFEMIFKYLLAGSAAAIILVLGVMFLVSPSGAVLETGADAPGFTLSDQNGNSHSLADYKGKWVVLAFYPKDGTPGCTMEARSIQSSLDEIAKLGAVVFGVSVQDSKSKEAFCKAEGLTYTLLADTEKKASEAYGVLTPSGMSARKTFIINPEGKVAKRMDEVNTSSHGADIVSALKELGGAGDYKPRTAGIKTLEPGAAAPDFLLNDVQEHRTHSLKDLMGKKGLTIVWVSTKCPVAIDYEGRLKALASKFRSKGINFVGINSNITEDFATTEEYFKKANLGFPILYDENHVIADKYGAMVTPDVFVVNPKGIIVYQGAIDDSQKIDEVKEKYLDPALTQLAGGQTITTSKTKAFGCTVKRAKRN